MSRDDTWNGNVFVQRLPPQGVTIETQTYFLQLLAAGRPENPEAVGRKANHTSIGKFKKDIAVLYPNAHSSRFKQGNQLITD